MQQAFLRSRTRIFILLTGIMIAVFLSLSRWLQWTSASAGLDSATQLHLLSGAAYSCLLVAVGSLRMALRLRKKERNQPFSILQIILLAYLLPMLVAWLPDWVAVGSGWDARSLWNNTSVWLPIIQAAALTILLLTGGDFQQPQVTGLGEKFFPAMLSGLLAGLGLWLSGAFIYGLALAFLPSLRASIAAFPPILGGILAAVALILLPVSEEAFFRGRLLPLWQTRFGLVAGSALSAALFALVLMRPVLFFPAFLAGLGLGYITRRSGLLAAILAHLVINALALLVIPALIF